MKRRTFLLASMAGSAATVAPVTRAQTYPTRPIRWVMPFPAGGPTDAVARKLADLAGAKLGQSVVVENKTGASGAIGTAEVVRSAPDGYTFAISTPDSLISAVSLIKSAGYDPRQDLTMVMKVCHAQPVLLASSRVGARNMKDLVAAATKAPGKITYASWGPGTLPHLVLASLERVTGTTFMEVPYKGFAPALQDLLGGNLDMALVPPNVAVQYRDKGLVALGVSGGGRAPLVPEVATMQEQGINAPIMNVTLWTGLVAPKGLPDPILKRWTEVLNSVVRSPEFETFLSTAGQSVLARSGADFAGELASEFVETGNLIRSLGIKPQ